MKILYITPEFSGSKSFFLNGSSWKGMPGQKYFVETLSRHDHKIYVIAQLNNSGEGWWKTSNIEVNYFSKNEGTIFVRALYRYFPKVVFTLYFWKIFIKYYRRIKKFDPDIIYGCWTFGAGLGSLFAGNFHKPFIVRMFGTGLAKYINDWDDLRQIIGPYEYYVRTLPFRVNSNALIITGDGTFGDEIAAQLGYPVNQTYKLRNGVDFRCDENVDKAELKKKWNIPGNSFLFTYTGRLEGWKRIDRVLHVFNEIFARDEDVYLILGGYGLDEEKILDYAKKNNFSGSLLITGPLEHEQIQEILWMSDVHLSLNDLTNLTNTTIEAMASGCCVVALNVGETRDLIVNGYNGILIDLDKLSCIADKLLCLMKDKKQREVLCLNAVKTIKQNFMSWEERINLEIKLMDELINTNC